jgi:hypothetical protein
MPVLGKPPSKTLKFSKITNKIAMIRKRKTQRISFKNSLKCLKSIAKELKYTTLNLVSSSLMFLSKI